MYMWCIAGAISTRQLAIKTPGDNKIWYSCVWLPLFPFLFSFNVRQWERMKNLFYAICIQASKFQRVYAMDLHWCMFSISHFSATKCSWLIHFVHFINECLFSFCVCGSLKLSKEQTIPWANKKIVI